MWWLLYANIFSLAPWRTADLGCIAVRKVATEQPLTADEFESTGPTSLAEREEAAKKRQQGDEGGGREERKMAAERLR